MITQTSVINFETKTVPNIVPVVQGDTGRQIKFTKNDITIPDGSTATFYVKKPSGEAVYDTATISDNDVLVDLTAQCLAEIGECPLQVRVTCDGEVVTSFDCILLVKPFHGLDAVPSTSETNIFDQKIADGIAQIQEEADSAMIGCAEQLDSTIIHTDSEPYLFRKTPYGTRAFPELVGGSVGWNQLVANTGSSLSVTVTSGHKYVMKKSGTWSVGSSGGSAITGLTGGTDIVTDITLLLGSTIADYVYTLESGTAGAGVAYLRKYGFFTKAYYPYDAGSMQSVKVSGHRTYGFNQWDEVWEVGGLSTTDGSPVDSSLTIRSKNFCQCIGGSSYYFKCSTYSDVYAMAVYWYDANQAFVSRQYACATIATAPANARYFKIVTNSSGTVYGTTYHNDICINLSNPSKNGQYEPYTKHEYALDSDLTLRGIFKKDANNKLYCDGDTYEADGTVTRNYELVNLGSLAWSYQGRGSDNGYIYKASIDRASTGEGVGTLPVVNNSSWGSTLIGTVNIGHSSVPLFGSSASATSESAYTSEVSGKYLVYKKATPTTEEADPFTVPQICSAYGTEEYVDERTVPVPVGHNTKTPADLRGKVEQLYGIPEAPTSNGTYTLKCTVSGGKPTYSWST